MLLSYLCLLFIIVTNCGFADAIYISVRPILHIGEGKILVLDLQQNSGKTAENVLKLILFLIKSGFVERKCVILLLCCVI